MPLQNQKELSSGERAALTRGDDIMTDEQAAFCFCVANGWSKDIMIGDTRTKFEQQVPVEKWPAWTSMKAESIRRAVEKFEFILEKTDKEDIIVYDKIKNYCNTFLDMKSEEVIQIASACVAIPDDNTLKKFAKKKTTLDKKDIYNAGRAIEQYRTIPAVKKKSDSLKFAKEMYMKSSGFDMKTIDALYIEYKKTNK